ncbi:MAG: bifunctional phosphoribosylaminoimidazolecarboxamide formyltransferase/IMP cyclohydrolase [Candidatus Omnitrophica bacterium]|nr:bifunctional phosphoribosylaminoimidazolecarboxamide formyltransferase/IMP cyclohydrolase [Candidatus Omnitrophota bacterium]
MLKIKRALVSVSDKTGLEELVKVLNEFKVEILSTGGTFKMIESLGIPVKQVSDYTGFPEMLDGRVKTLHPKVHAGLLARRDLAEHMKQVEEHNIGLIDMVVVNLYPFEKVASKPDAPIEGAIENIDIGGPSMLRSAAKNYKSVAVVCNNARYSQIIKELKTNSGCLSEGLLRELAAEVFARTSSYDSAIAIFFREKVLGIKRETVDRFTLDYTKKMDLRYGENPHQRAALYIDKDAEGISVAGAPQLHGKEMSFNNFLDLNAAYEIANEFEEPTAVIIKHTNPCGVASADTLDKAFKDALSCDKLSAFGGIIGFNRMLDKKTAVAISKSGFFECIIAPDYGKDALELLKEKKNIRLMKISPKKLSKKEVDLKKINGGLLVQDKDEGVLDLKTLKYITKKKPTKAQLESLIFGWKVAKHVKSNAIVLTKGKKTVGVGAGQMSRVDSTLIAIRKAGKLAKNSCLASDAFFPKEDAIEVAKKSKISAIIQPGGSIADEEIIKKANQFKIAMVFTGIRHFKH